MGIHIATPYMQLYCVADQSTYVGVVHAEKKLENWNLKFFSKGLTDNSVKFCTGKTFVLYGNHILYMYMYMYKSHSPHLQQPRPWHTIGLLNRYALCPSSSS